MNLEDNRNMLTEYTDLLYASPDGFAYSNPSDANGETHVTWSDGDGYPFIYLSHPLEFSPWFYARSVPDEKKFEYDDSQRFVVKSGLHVGDINERHADLYVGIILEYFHWLKDCGYMTQDDIDEETAGNYFEEDYIYDMGLDDLRDYNDAVVGKEISEPPIQAENCLSGLQVILKLPISLLSLKLLLNFSEKFFK